MPLLTTELAQEIEEVFQALDPCDNKTCEAVAEWIGGPPCGCRSKACTNHLQSWLRRMSAFMATSGGRGRCTQCNWVGPPIPMWEPIR